MRILQIMAGARQGGAEAFFERLTAAFARAGHAQILAIRADPDRAARLQAQGLDVRQAPFGGPFDIRTRPLLRKLAREFEPRVALAWMNRAAAMAPKGPHVLVGRLGGYYDLKYYRNCDHLVGNTADIRDYIVRSGWPAERAHVAPNFPDDAPVAPADDLQDRPAILALGRLHPNKAFDVALRALAGLDRGVLYLAGEGPERERLQALGATLGVGDRLRWLGWRTDAPALIAAADLVLVPSRHEPLGNVVLEAWARGKPVVAAASQGPAALIRDGESGLLVPVEDSAALAVAMKQVLDDPALAARLGGGGRAAFQARFTEAAAIAQWTDLLERVSA